ncbi:indole-3-glycerol phosphate synthase TrpC [Candidatus Poribacteria bacterium]|nr:indole-3-glycerol phosphate synthase TrpC [Candidatus Poribacteria bacterium]
MRRSILDKIVAHKRKELRRDAESVPRSELVRVVRDLPPTKPFADAIRRSGGVRLIAEVKKASPSKGVIREDFDPVAIAQAYEEGGAHALSVLTDERFFQGSLAYLREIRAFVELPILRKDFTLSEYHVYQARAAGADAILLVVAILGDDHLRDLLACASENDLACLVEVHDETELDRALAAGATIIGVNNRDLRTFETRLETTFRLRERIPPDRICVSESGIDSRGDVERLDDAGVDAMLVGESLMRSDDIAAKVRELVGSSSTAA